MRRRTKSTIPTMTEVVMLGWRVEVFRGYSPLGRYFQAEARKREHGLLEYLGEGETPLLAISELLKHMKNAKAVER